MASLAEMKAERGGRCNLCSVDITSADQKDHSFCNSCWWKLFQHPSSEDLDYCNDKCLVCGELNEDEIHASINPYQQLVH